MICSMPHIMHPYIGSDFQVLGQCVQELLYSYNIGIDRQKRQRQKLSDSARSVGLSLPDWTN